MGQATSAKAEQPTPKTKKSGSSNSTNPGGNESNVETLLKQTQQTGFSEEQGFAMSIPSKNIWRKLAHRPIDKTFARCEVVKAIIHVLDPSKLDNSPIRVYYLDSVRWHFHWEFARDVLSHPTARSLKDFNNKQYIQDDRDFILCTITRYKDQGVWALELAPRDTLNGSRIGRALRHLQSEVYCGDSLRFRPVSQRHSESIATMEGLPTVTTKELFGSVKFQPLSVGECYGKLLLVPRGDKCDEIVEDADPSTILVCEEIPNDIPAIAGLITGEVQTALCHVALLCANRQTPNMALVGATTTDSFQRLNNKWVKLSVTMQDYQLEAAEEDVALQWLQERTKDLQKHAADSIFLPHCLEDTGIIELATRKLLPRDERDRSIEYIGAKAHQLLNVLFVPKLGSLTSLDPIKEAFVVPFFYCHQHVQENCAELLREALETNAQSGKAKLASLRDAIEAAPVQGDNAASSLVGDIIDRVSTWKESGILDRCDGIILRSSTNVEDLEGFNGAGLYESKSIAMKDCFNPEKIARTLKYVWASLWNWRGFQERKLFGIKEDNVHMAVLVQPFFGKKSVYCNGVAITANPFRNDFSGMLMNVQVGTNLVTDAKNGTTPESILAWQYNFGPMFEKLSTSSEREEILRKEDAEKMFAVLQLLDSSFANRDDDILQEGSFYAYLLRNCVDIEFLLLNGTEEKPTKQIVILQCRPFQQRYSPDPSAADDDD